MKEFVMMYPNTIIGLVTLIVGAVVYRLVTHGIRISLENKLIGKAEIDTTDEENKVEEVKS